MQQQSRIYGIQIWHYFGEPRVYRDVIVCVSNDPYFAKGVTTVYNNDQNNSSNLGAGKEREYYESNQGFRIDTRGKDYRGVTARYVRLYSKGNSADPQNQYIEVEVVGQSQSANSLKPIGNKDRKHRGDLKFWQSPLLPSPYQQGWNRLTSRTTKSGITIRAGFIEVPKQVKSPKILGEFLVPSDAFNIAYNFNLKYEEQVMFSSKVDEVLGQRSSESTLYSRWETLPPGLQWIQLDLRKIYYIHAIRLWHFFEDGRTYHDVIVQVADDEKFTRNVHTIFNNDRDNSAKKGKGTDKEYAEREGGLFIDTRGKELLGTPARFIRFYSRGNSVNSLNHYVAAEVIANHKPLYPPGQPNLTLWKTDIPQKPFW